MSRKLGGRQVPSSEERSLLYSDHVKRMNAERMRRKLAQFSPTVTLLARDDKTFSTERDGETNLCTIEEGEGEDREEEAKEGGGGVDKGGSSSKGQQQQKPARRVGKEKIQATEAAPPDKPDVPPTIPKKEDPPKIIVPSFTRKYLLFQMRLTPDDVKQESSLFIPVEITLDKDFLPPPPRRGAGNWEEKIGISDTSGRVWYVKVGYSYEECGFLVDSEWWQGFCASHNLVAKDVIGFYGDRDGFMGKTVLDKHHYLIEREAYKSTHAIFKKENFDFQWLLSQDNVIFGWLNFDKDIVREYFPDIRIPSAETHYKERLYFTDNHNREYCVQIRFETEFSIYTFNFEEFFKKRKVKAGDILRFFAPVEPLTSRHYLIQHLIYEPETNQTPPQPPDGGGTAKKDKQVKIGDNASVDSSSCKQAQSGTSAGKEHVKRHDYVIKRSKASGIESSSKQAQSGTSATTNGVKSADEAGPSGTKRNEDDRSGGRQSSCRHKGKKKLFGLGGCCMPLHRRKRSGSRSDLFKKGKE